MTFALREINNTQPMGHFELSVNPQESLVKTWKLLGERDVRLIRSEDTLKFEVFDRLRLLIQGQIDLPVGHSIESAIEHLTKLEPVVVNEDTVRFERRVEQVYDRVLSGPAPVLQVPQEEPTAYRSSLDPNVVINNHYWAVTMVDSLGSEVDLSNPLRWGGHANLYIEKVNKGVYKIWRAHLVSGDYEKSTGRVKYHKIKDFRPEDSKSKTITWIKPKNDIQRMISHIKNAISEQEKGNFTVHMDLRGQGIMTRFHNCFTWARETLGIAGIHLFHKDNLFTTYLFKAPAMFIGENLITSKQCIYVLIKISDHFSITEGPEISANVVSKIRRIIDHNHDRVATNTGLSELPIDIFDITEEVDKAVGRIPWSLFSLDRSGRYSMYLTINKGKYTDEMDIFSHFQEPVNMIIATTPGNGLKIDVSSILRNNLIGRRQARINFLRACESSFTNDSQDFG